MHLNVSYGIILTSPVALPLYTLQCVHLEQQKWLSLSYAHDILIKQIFKNRVKQIILSQSKSDGLAWGNVCLMKAGCLCALHYYTVSKFLQCDEYGACHRHNGLTKTGINESWTPLRATLETNCSWTGLKMEKAATQRKKMITIMTAASQLTGRLEQNRTVNNVAPVFVLQQSQNVCSKKKSL